MPPMPTSASGVGRPSRLTRSAAIASSALARVSSETGLSSPNSSVGATAPSGTLYCSSMRLPCPNVNWELPPPLSKTASDESGRFSSAVAAR